MFIALPLAPIGIFGMIFSPAIACAMTLGYSTLLFLYFLYNYFFGCHDDDDEDCDPDCPGNDWKWQRMGKLKLIFYIYCYNIKCASNTVNYIFLNERKNRIIY